MNPQREAEIRKLLEHTSSKSELDLEILKHMSPSLILLWLTQAMDEIDFLRKRHKSEDDTKENPNG